MMPLVKYDRPTRTKQLQLPLLQFCALKLLQGVSQSPLYYKELTALRGARRCSFIALVILLPHGASN
jgi:hypothetical protein